MKSLRLFALVVLTSAGCKSWLVYRAARLQGANDLACPEGSLRQVYSSQRSAYRYTFAGCGRQVVIRCMESVSASDVLCVTGP